MPDDSTRAHGCAVLEMLRSGGVSALRRSFSELQNDFRTKVLWKGGGSSTQECSC